MKKIVPDPPATPLETALSTDPLLDQAAADRALNHYLLKPPVPQPSKTSSVVICDSVSLESALVETSGLLRCASASAGEVGNSLSGAQRDLVLSVLHLVDLARGIRRQIAGRFEYVLMLYAPGDGRRV